MIHSKQHRGCRLQGPETRGYRWWKTADFSHSAGTAHGAPPLRTKMYRSRTFSFWCGAFLVEANGSFREGCCSFIDASWNAWSSAQPLA